MIRKVLLLLLIAASANATTRFVSKAGADGNPGTSWATAWLTLSKVSASTVGGDTVVFGTGIWRDATLYPKTGTSGDRTCYIDSGFYYATRTTYPTTRRAWLYGSDSLTGWTLVSGNIYRVSHAAVNTSALWQGEQLLWGQSSQAAVNGPGKWYTDGSNIYAWAYGGGNPNAYDMEYPMRDPASLVASGSDNTGQDYVSFVGLGFRYGQNSIMQNHTGGSNQVNGLELSHCYLSCVANEYSANPSLLITETNQIANAFNYYGRINACSLGTVMSLGLGTPPQASNSSHGNCVTLYSAWGWKIDSNIVTGYQSHSGIYLKFGLQNGTLGDSTGELAYDTIAFNNINCQTGSEGLTAQQCLRLFGAVKQTRVYGNIFRGANRGILIDYSSVYGYGNEGYHYIYNNTFYTVGGPAVAQFNQEAGATPYYHFHSQFKYNVVYASTGRNQMDLDVATRWDNIDSNMYYAASGTNTWMGGTWATWQARTGGTGLTFDTHNSTNTTNPGFNNTSLADFSRPSAGTEMNQTYGGRTWTKYGAVQGTVTADTTTYVSIADGGAIEGNNVVFTVTASQTVGTSNLAFTATFTNGTATNPTNYAPVANPNSYSIPIGSTSTTISIPTNYIAGYAAPGYKTFTVTLSGIASQRGAFTRSTATGTITELDSPNATTIDSIGGNVELIGNIEIK